MSQVVIENPIINSPFDEPTRHFRFTDEGITNEIVDGRRVVFQKWRSTAIDVTLHLRLTYPKARREVHDIDRGPMPSLSQ